jgi:ATP-dependent DNA helicase RecG
MPSALEKLVKILKLEQEQGCRNTAVIGGLERLAPSWHEEAHQQARRPEHHILVDELSDLLRAYVQIDTPEARSARIGYMLDRIMGRAKPPEAYQARLGDYAPPAPPAAAPAPAADESTAEGEAAPAEPPPEPRRRKEKARKAEARQEAAPQEKPQRQPARAEGKRGQGAGRAARDEDEDAQAGAGNGYHNESSRLDDYIDFSSSKPGKRDLPLPARLVRPPRIRREPIDPQAAADLLYGLNNSVDRVKGVGPKQQELLANLGIHTINDLLFYLPTRYDDYTQMIPIGRLTEKTLVTVIGTIRHAEVRAGKSGRRDFSMVVEDSTGRLGVTCFGQPYLGRTLQPGMQVLLRGQTSLYQNRIQLTNPEIQPLDIEDLQAARIVPVYPLTEGLNNRQLRRIIERALDYWESRIPDYLPEGTLERLDLADLGWALRQIHFPEGMDHHRHAQRRLAFDQLLMMQLTIMANRRQWQAVPAQPLPIEDDLLDGLIGTMFPYPLTGAQRRCIQEIRADMARAVPMNRLLQGDVGSGKTAVSAAALAIAVAGGGQAVLMAPTSILAEQHYIGISAALGRIPEGAFPSGRPVVGLLTGAVRGTEREGLLNGLRDGSVDVVIGTQALIQSGVEFRNLALGIIDEQHRFGVEQRGALRGKGTNPHLLIMTATPIPRTLALTLHADLDLSIIDEMPPGRTPVRTRVIEPTQRVKAWEMIEDQINQGRQAFIVYPLVEASERIEAESAVENYEALQKVFFRHRVGLLHGRMSPDEKDEVMAAFRERQFDVLVTTSVAEVGVDIPNATIIVIEGANRFGLAQLHQFRGRVGRGGFPSICLLIPDSQSPEALARLMILEKNSDGFALAQKDFELRGAGDLLGTQQSGKDALAALEGMDIAFIEAAQREARTLYAIDPDLEQPEHYLLAVRIRALQDARADIS